MSRQDLGPVLDIASARRRTKGDNLPGFLASAIDRPTSRTARSGLLNARLQLRDLFTPAQPVTQRSRFAGRLDVLANLIEIIEENSFKVKTGMFSNWYARMKKDVGMA